MLVVPNRLKILSAWAGVLLLGVCSATFGQTPPPNSEAQVMGHLNLVLRWSRQWDSIDVYLSRPGDEIYVENGRDIAQQVLKLEFQSALAQAALLGGSSPKNAPSSGDTQNDAHNILNLQQRTAQQLQELQKQLDEVNHKISVAKAKDRPALTARRDTLKGQCQLEQALLENLQKLGSFVTSSENSNGAVNELSGKILALQRNILGGAPMPGAKPGKSSGSSPVVSGTRNEGLIGQMGQMIHLMGSLRALNRLEKDATHLQDSTRQLRAPLLASLRATLQQGQVDLAGSGQGGPNSGTGANVPPASATAGQTSVTPAQQQQAMKELVRHFKLLSDATLPLSQELILVDQSQANLDQLQASIKHDYVSILRTLLLRVAGILLALVVIWLLAELWRRATFRYVRDARRRRQFLVLRRVVIGFCMAVIVLLGFVSDFSSLATYAGLITAGIAVALQAIILSVAAYFFLVGRYGVRVGDRVTVVYNASNSVTGDVVDIGLVRFYMMELAGSGVDMQPTGRMCIFPNSVLFQTNPLFKQLPGTEYMWREIALPLSSESDGQLAEKELLAVVDKFCSEYQPLLEHQHRSVENAMGVYVDVPKPHTRVRFIGSGIEVMVRYPIPLRQAGELDDRMVMEISELLRKNPTIQLAPGATPNLRSAVKG